MTAAATEAGVWLEEIPGRLTAIVDLICFPGAGAGASIFRRWRADLPAFATLLACQLPGRESRIEEAPVESLSQAAEAVAAAYLRKRPRPRPLALFGHSMGGVLAFETARCLAVEGRSPDALLISASEPPRAAKGPVTERSDLEALLLAYDPENIAVVGNPELAGPLLPILESDIGLLRRHELRPKGALLDVPVWLFGGSDDRGVPAGAVARWAEHFTGRVTVAELPGGHQFPFRESSSDLLQTLSPILRDAAERRGA